MYVVCICEKLSGKKTACCFRNLLRRHLHYLMACHFRIQFYAFVKENIGEKSTEGCKSKHHVSVSAFFSSVSHCNINKLTKMIDDRRVIDVSIQLK